jgi:hypothetical protein
MKVTYFGGKRVETENYKLSFGPDPDQDYEV